MCHTTPARDLVIREKNYLAYKVKLFMNNLPEHLAKANGVVQQVLEERHSVPGNPSSLVSSGPTSQSQLLPGTTVSSAPDYTKKQCYRLNINVTEGYETSS